MLVKEVFSTLHSYSYLKESPLWNLEFDGDNPEVIQSIEMLFQYEFNFHINLLETEICLVIVHEHFDQIIMRKSEDTFEDQVDIFSYFQFVWGLSVTTHLNLISEFIYCHDVFFRSVFDFRVKHGDQYNLDCNSIQSLLGSENAYVANSIEVIDQWLSQLYYYSRAFSGLNEWCKYFLDWLLQRQKYYPIREYTPLLLSNIYAWCETNYDELNIELAKEIIIEKFSNISWSLNHKLNEIKSLFGVQILLIIDYEKDKKQLLFEEINKHVTLDESLFLQCVVALCFDEDSFIDNYDLLIDSISKHNQKQSQYFKDDLDAINQKTAYLRNFSRLIHLAIDIEKPEYAEELLIKYFEINSPKSVGDILFIILNSKDSVKYSLPGSLFIDEKNSQDLCINLVDVENKSFNAYRIIKGGQGNQIIPSGKEVGLPSVQYSDEYKKILKELYNFPLIENCLQTVKSIIQFDFNGNPIQYLMIDSIQKTLPLNLSLSNKIRESPVEKILIWCGSSITSEIESQSLAEIFSFCHIDYEIHDSNNSSKNFFLERIRDFMPNILWISSHGEHKHFEPNLSEIILSETDSIKIREYHYLKHSEKHKRLLFLNICEGGSHAQVGEFKNLGFPNLLTSFNQDVISHLWMANPHFACVFGVLMAIGIAFHKMEYFKAFSYSLLVINEGRENILNELDSLPFELQNLKDRIVNNTSMDWSNIINIGSPVYHI